MLRGYYLIYEPYSNIVDCPTNFLYRKKCQRITFFSARTESGVPINIWWPCLFNLLGLGKVIEFSLPVLMLIYSFIFGMPLDLGLSAVS